MHVQMESCGVAIYSSEGTRIVQEPSLGITVVLHGETYGNSQDSAAELLQTFRESGADGIARIHGSFVAIVCDAKSDQIIVITDRINSRKAYTEQVGDTHWLASCPALFPRRDRTLDPVGVGWYLTHGTVYDSRTIFCGVRLLERASVHELTRGGFVSRRYWQYSFTSPSHASERELSEQMGQIIVRAVQRRLAGRSTIFLALSAGYDSAAILGVLGKSLGIQGVRCFSYAQGAPQPGSDEFVSAQMAAEYGYSHRIVQSFAGNVVDLLRLNVEMGMRTCEEIDAWLDMAEKFNNVPAPILLAGDECLGWTDYLLKDDTDVLRAVQIDVESSAGLLREIMAGSAASDAVEGMRQDARNMLARCSGMMDRHDMKDFLYLDQRMPQTIMMWREFNAGRFIHVANPLLDYDVLDFMQTVPTRWRRQKRLFRRTVNRMFPEVFGFSRAKFASAQLDARRAVYHQREKLENLLKNQPSRLDSLVDPEIGWRMLRELPEPRVAEFPTMRSRLRRTLTHAIDTLGMKDAMRPYVSPVAAVAPIHQTVWRWLVLRTALGPQLPDGTATVFHGARSSGTL